MQSRDQIWRIQDNAERSFLVLWLLTVLVSSLVGDSIILIATCRYKALNLHKVLVAIIQHMAVCDLLQSIFQVFSSTTAVIADRWVLGEVIGHIQDNLWLLTAGYAMLLTCALTTVKLMHLNYPLVARTWSKNAGHATCLALIGFVLVVYSPVFVVKMLFSRELRFSYINYVCQLYNDHDQFTELPHWFILYSPICFSLFHFLCYSILVINSILILLKAKKVRSRTGGGVRLQGTVTVLLTVAVHFLSYLPSCVLYVSWMAMGVDYTGNIWRAVTYAVYLNTMANFYIYYFTARSFREFLKHKITVLKQSIQNKISPRPKLVSKM